MLRFYKELSYYLRENGHQVGLDDVPGHFADEDLGPFARGRSHPTGRRPAVDPLAVPLYDAVLGQVSELGQPVRTCKVTNNIIIMN